MSSLINIADSNLLSSNIVERSGTLFNILVLSEDSSFLVKAVYPSLQNIGGGYR